MDSQLTLAYVLSATIKKALTMQYRETPRYIVVITDPQRPPPRPEMNSQYGGNFERL